MKYSNLEQAILTSELGRCAEIEVSTHIPCVVVARGEYIRRILPKIISIHKTHFRGGAIERDVNDWQQQRL